MEALLMKTTALIACAAIVAAVFSIDGVLVGAQRAQYACADVRKHAITLARSINTAQLHIHTKQKSFQALKELAGVSVPPHLTVQLVHSASQFVFSIKETIPACDIAVFSDQEYLIYTALPLQ
jgi:hypothetical protein